MAANSVRSLNDARSLSPDQIQLPFGDVTIPAGTSVDLQELAARGYRATTLELSDGSLWEASFEAGGATLALEALEQRGIYAEDMTDIGFSARVGTQQGESCVIGTGDEHMTLFLSRPVTADADCPLVSELRSMLPTLSHTARTQPDVAWGTALGSFNGVTAYSNGSVSYVGPYSTYGYQYQCVEYVNRYYVQALGWKNMRGSGNANQYCTNTGTTGLKVYSNGGTTAPKVNDVLVSKGGGYGHVAIVREVGANYVKVIEQNWCNCSSDANTQISMTVSSGKYTVSGFSSSYPVACWARK